MALPAAIWAICLLAVPLQVAAQIRVMTPDTLVQELTEKGGRIEGTTATFGAPFYGDRILGRIIWPEAEERGHLGCNDGDYKVPPEDTTKTPQGIEQVRLISIIMVRRGGCSFTKKVRVAAKHGAHAVIFVDMENSSLTSQEMRNVIVADDGFGGSVHIPSVLIDKEDGRKLINEAQRGSKIVVELAWDVPTNAVVNVDLWMSSASSESLKFLKEFAPKRRTLNRVVNFVPHYSVFGMDESNGQLATSHLCIENGKYCAEDPDGPGRITGADVLYEDVRQLCIHETYKKTTELTNQEVRNGKPPVEYAEEYWSYIEQFLDTCPPIDTSDANTMFGESCSVQLMAKLGIDATKINQCVESTRNDKLDFERRNPAWSPRALRINGWRYSGILDADLVTRAICSGFSVQPQECKDIISPRDPFVTYVGNKEANGVSFGTLILWLGGTVAAAFSCLLLYKRYDKKEMRSTLREEVMLEVQAQMGQYSKLPH